VKRSEPIDPVAAIREKLGNPPDALQAIEHLLTQEKQAAALTPRDRAHVFHLQARALRALGQHQEALPALAQAVFHARQAGDDLLALQMRIGEIDSLGMLGQWEEAQVLAHQLASKLKEAGAAEDAARALGNLGSLYLRCDRYEEALQTYSEGASLLDNSSSPQLRAGIAVNQAITLTYLRQFDAALGQYELARSLYGDEGGGFESAVVDNNVGFLHFTAGRYGAALAHLIAASTVFQEKKRDHEFARCEIDCGDVYRASNLFEEAERCYRNALTIFARLPLEYDQARAEMGCAASLAAQGKAEPANRLLALARTRFAAQKNEVQAAHVSLILASGAGLTVTGEEVVALRNADATFTRHGLDGWAAEARLRLREIAAENFGEFAEESAEERAELEAIAATARRTAYGWLECRAERMLGRSYLRSGQRLAATRHLRASVAALESVRVQMAPEELHLAFLTDKEAVYADLIQLLLTEPFGQAEITESLQLLEQTRSPLLLERILTQQKSRESVPDESREIWERLARVRAELSRIYREALSLEESERRRPDPIRSDDLIERENLYVRLVREADQAGLLPVGAFPRSPRDIAQLQEALSPEETLLYYCRVGDNLGIFLIGKEKIEAFPRLSPWETVGDTVRRFRYHLQKMEMAPELRLLLGDSLQKEMDNVLTVLFDLLLAPFAERLVGKRLVVIPCDPIQNIPFHALRSGDQYVLDRWETVLAPSAAIWRALNEGARRTTVTEREEEQPQSSLLVGVSAYGLARVREELDQIAPLLPQPLLLQDGAATSDAVRHAMRGASVCHFATHALFRQDNPLFSGLHLADGWLLARDLYTLPLRADLVTLSACATGASHIGSGGEWMGLARGFLAAGAQRVVASLWPADDTVTTELMAIFYDSRQTEAGTDRTSRALRTAQQAIRRRYPHPYYWAAFRVIGSR
jgi:CHAT domain-containing protein/tetratricopeptide (TPR) repeat protein